MTRHHVRAMKSRIGWIHDRKLAKTRREGVYRDTMYAFTAKVSE